MVARPVEPQINDPVPNQIERADRIALQDGYYLGNVEPVSAISCQSEYRVNKRERTLDTWRCQHCEAMAARLEEPQIHDPV